MLRNEDLLTLPSRTLLRHFTGPTPSEVGVTSFIRHRCVVQLSTIEDFHRDCTLQMDEMQIKQSLTYDKNHDALVGYVDMGGIVKDKDTFGDIDEPIDDLEEPIDDVEEPIKDEKNKKLANKLLCFMVTGLSKPYKIPVAYFYVNSITGEELYQLTLHVLTEIESMGFRVLRLAGDNAKTNKYVFEKLTHSNGLRYVVPHPINKERLLICSHDYCHIIKCIRNLWLTRDFEINGVKVSFEPIRALYRLQCKRLLRATRYITRKHVYPNNLERQKVVWAVAIFRPDMTAALQLYHDLGYPEFQNIDETIKFMKMIYKWWCIHDISNQTHGIFQRNPDQVPFYDVDDDRLVWLEETFPSYINKWKSEAPNKKNFLSNETYNALIATSVATAEAIKYLLQTGKEFVLTRRFSTDNIESFFGAVRQVHGGNDRPTAEKTTTAISRLVRTGELQL